MKIVIGSSITISSPTQEICVLCNRELVIDNPDYISKLKAGRWIGNTPPKMYLYERRGDDLVVPFGFLNQILKTQSGANARVVWESYKPKDDFVADYKSTIHLYDYQQNVVDKMIMMRNGIAVMPCGSGKTQTALECVARLGLKTLWLTHTQDLLNQSLERAKNCFDCNDDMFGTITAGKVNIRNGITFATVQTMCKLDLAKYRTEWAVVVVDECMPGNTKILTKNGEKLLKNLQKDDIITTYNRETQNIEYKRVTHLFKHKAHDVVKIIFENGETIISTKNHPFYTINDKWVNAGDLRSDCYVMRLLRKRNRFCKTVKNELLSQPKKRLGVLLQRMCKNSWKTKDSDNRRTSSKIFRNNESYKSKISRSVCKSDENKQSHEKFRDTAKSIKKIKRNRTSPKNQMWKRARINSTTAKIVNCISRKSNRSICRISHIHKTKARQRISDLLQSRYRFAGIYACNRNRRRVTHDNRTSETRYKERQLFEWVRVESVEIQEQTSDGTYGGLCADGYVYNIEVEDNNNYFANGILVHNCQHCCGSPTRVTQFYKVVNSLYAPYKFGLTATPKRSNGLEKSMFALIGDVIAEVDKSEVQDKTCPVKVQVVETGYYPDVDKVLNGDGTINYNELIKDLIDNTERLQIVSSLINEHCKQYSMVLASRIQYLETLQKAYSGRSVLISTMGTSKKAKQERKTALKMLNDGEIDCIFATYQLAAEGLDCPNLRYVVFATPEQNERTVVQAVGRVARKADGKSHGTVIDCVDSFGMYQGWAKKRKRYYKKIGVEEIT